jgi:MFS family permease
VDPRGGDMDHREGDRRTLRRNVRELPATAWFLIGGSFINRFGSFVVPFLVLYLRSKGFSIAQAGTAVAAYGGGEVIAGGIGGYLADRIGRRFTIAVSMFSSAAAMIALSQVRGYWLILTIAFLAGLVSEARRPAALATLTDVVPEGQRITAFAIFRLVENVGFAGGIALGGFLANTSFLWLFFGDAASSVAYGVVALAALPDSRAEAPAEGGRREGYRQVFADRAFVVFLAATVLLSFVYFQQLAALPLHVIAHGLSNADFGLLLAFNGVLVILFELPLTSLTMRRPQRQMIAGGFLLVGLGFGLTAIANSLFALFGTVAIWTLGEMIAAPVGYAYVADIAPAHLRGRYQGLYGTSFSSGAIVGPALGTLLYARGEMGFWILCGGLGAASALLALTGRQPASTSRPPGPRSIKERVPAWPVVPGDAAPDAEQRLAGGS